MIHSENEQVPLACADFLLWLDLNDQLLVSQALAQQIEEEKEKIVELESSIAIWRKKVMSRHGCRNCYALLSSLLCMIWNYQQVEAVNNKQQIVHSNTTKLYHSAKQRVDKYNEEIRLLRHMKGSHDATKT